MHAIVLIIIFVTALSSPLWIFMLSAILYALWKVGYALLGIGFIIDALFGGYGTGLPYLYTLTAAIIITAAEFIKPYLRYYEHT